MLSLDRFAGFADFADLPNFVFAIRGLAFRPDFFIGPGTDDWVVDERLVLERVCLVEDELSTSGIFSESI